MKKEQYIITELLDGGIGQTKPVIWQHAMTHDNKKVTFWGRLESMRNIKSIENQEIPFIAEILGAEENIDFKRKYGTDISVNEGCYVTVHPLSAQMIRLMMSGSPDKLIEQISIMQKEFSEKRD
jgi:hypothetical protein